LGAVRKGQTMLITDRGKPVAKVSPPEQDSDSQLTFSDVLKKLETEGKIRLLSARLENFEPCRRAGNRGPR
jgi:antitoxin (DNA-binding transcriptional repressor) of toxin-antitoxin stability system